MRHEPRHGIQLTAGNEPPLVSLNILQGNKTFFFPGQPLQYAIEVRDKEDGNVTEGTIKSEQVAVNFDYVPEGFDLIAIAQNHRTADEKAGFSAGLYLISSSDCKSCHTLDKPSVGPSFLDISKRYKSDPSAVSHLTQKVIEGGFGVWGEHTMSAHPQLPPKNVEMMVKYILSTAEKQPPVKPLPLKGTFQPKVPAGENGKGGYLLRAAYTDKGAGSIASLSSESVVALRSASVDPQKADIKHSTRLLTTPTISFSMIGDGSYLGFKNIDLTGIKQIQFLAQATPNSGDVGGVIEVHLDAPDGKLIGQTDMVVSKPLDIARLMEMFEGKPKEGAKPKGPNPPASKQPADKGKDKDLSAADFDFSILTKLLSSQVVATLEPVEGMHNIYFVFKNDKVGAGESLMQMVEINFQNTVTAPVTAGK